MVGTVPYVGLNPTTPHSAAGTRMDARVSVPSDTRPIPVATAIAEPPLDPPGMRVGSCGLRACGLVTPSANSCVLVLPRITAPAARQRSTAAASTSGTWWKASDPQRVGMPPTWITSFTLTGMPCSGPRARLGVTGARLRQRAFGVDVHERRPLVLLDPRERRLDEFHARRARRHGGQPAQRGQWGDGGPEDVVCRALLGRVGDLRGEPLPRRRKGVRCY